MTNGLVFYDAKNIPGNQNLSVTQWYDQSGNARHLLRGVQTETIQLRMESLAGGAIPSVHITGGNYMYYQFSQTISSFTYAGFLDFSFTSSNPEEIDIGLLGVELNPGDAGHTTLIKNREGYKLLVTQGASSNQLLYQDKGSVEGRLATCFQIAPNDRRFYLGDKVVASLNTQSSFDSYTSGRIGVGALRAYTGYYITPGTEFFEIWFFNIGMTSDRILNLMRNMTQTFAAKG